MINLTIALNTFMFAPSENALHAYGLQIRHTQQILQNAAVHLQWQTGVEEHSTSDKLSECAGVISGTEEGALLKEDPEIFPEWKRMYG
jgi:hypothetical protein